MRVHYYTLDHIVRGVLPNPPKVAGYDVLFTTNLEHAWDGIGPWRA